MQRDNRPALGAIILSSLLAANSPAALLAQDKVESRSTTAKAARTVTRKKRKAPAAHKKRPRMDLAFCIDTTGSMQGEIDQVKEKVKSLVAKLASGKPTPIVRVALVAYRDKDDSYVTRTFNFTDDIDKFVQDISALRAAGGGDAPEAVNDAILAAVKELQWDKSRKTAKLLFLIGDAGPHPSVQDWQKTCQDAIAHGIQINTIGCDGLQNFPEKTGVGFFKKVAKLTDGKFEMLAYRQTAKNSDGSSRTFIRSGGRTYELSSAARDEWKKGARVLSGAGKARAVRVTTSRAAGRAALATSPGFSPASAPMAVNRRDSNLDALMYGAALKKSRDMLDVDYAK